MMFMKINKLLNLIGVSILTICLFGCSNTKTEDMAISSDGVHISFEKKGKVKPAILFVHGWTNSRTVWEDQMEYFSKDYTAIAVDLAGSGKSGHNRNDWTIKAFSKDVISVMDKLKLDKVVLVGFSMGATVTVETANQVPDRILGVVTVDELKYPGRQIPKEMIPSIVDDLMTFMVSGMTNKNLVARGFYKRNEEAAFKRISEMYDNVPHIGWQESLEGFFKWTNENQKASLKQLKVPFRGIFSDREPFEIDSIKNYVPSLNCEIIPNTGHLVFWDDPEKFNELLEKYIIEFME